MPVRLAAPAVLSRTAAVFLLLLSLTVPALTILHTSAQDAGSADAPIFRGNPARTGELPGPGPDLNEPIVRHWTYETGGHLAASPAVANGLVYISSTDTWLYAIDAQTGEERWSAEIGYSESPPTIADGVVYVGTSENVLIALDAETGEQRWYAEFSPAITEELIASPVVVDGVVYVGSSDGSFNALDAATGEERWSVKLGWMRASAAVADGVVYIPQRSLALYALDAATGEQRWLFEGGNLYASYLTSPAVADGTVYVFDNYDSQLHAIDVETGESRWAHTLPLESMASLNASPAVSNGTVYLGASDGLHAIDTTTGEERWLAPAAPMLDSSPVVVDGIVYLASNEGFYAIDAETGDQAWYTPTDYPIETSAAVAGGLIYLVIGSRLIAVGNPSPAMQTATAQAQATATAQAHLNETAVAVSAITATAQAHLDATATSVAGATATSEAQAYATSEAIQQVWNTYFWTDISGALSSAVAEFPGMSTDITSPIRIAESYVPTGAIHEGRYPVSIAGGSASAMVLLQIFPSKADADDAMETITGGLIRSGWESQDVKGLDHNHVCLTVEYSTSAEALCFVTRDDALIVSYSAISLPKPDAVLTNATDLAQTMNDVYDQTDRPD